MRQHLGAIFGSVGSERLDPLGCKAVLLGPLSTRDLAVGDVANDQVEECILRLASDRGPPLTTHELLALEHVERLIERPTLPSVERSQRAPPEDLSDHRCVLNESLLLGGERVEPGGDESLQGLG